MTRISKALMLSSENRSALNTIIREHEYCQLDVMVGELKKVGITLSRASLHRYIAKLRKMDGVNCPDGNITMVVLVCRATGRSESVFTAMSIDQAKAVLEPRNVPTEPLQQLQ